MFNSLLFSQQRLSWKKCVEYAMINNLDIGHYQLLTETQKINVNEAKHGFLPSVGAGTNYNQNFGRSIDPNTNDIINSDFFANSYYLQGSAGLFQGFSRVNRLKMEKYMYRYNEQNLESQKIIIAFDILESYFSALFYKGLIDIANEQAAISTTELHKTRKMVELGKASESEIPEIEAQLASDSLSIVQAQVQYTMYLHSLKRLMNFPLHDTLLIQEPENDKLDPLNTVPLSTNEEIMNQGINHLHEIQMIELNLKAAEKRLAEVKGYASPGISLNSSWSSGYFETIKDTNGAIIPLNEQLKGNAQTNIRLSLHFPLFNRLQNYDRIQRAKLNYQIAQNNYKKKLKNTEYEIQSNILELESAIKEYQASVKNENKQKKAFEIAAKKLNSGLIDLISYDEVKNQYANAQTETLRTGLQLYLKSKTIQYYLTGEIL